jgi:hypothetical protein
MTALSERDIRTQPFFHIWPADRFAPSKWLVTILYPGKQAGQPDHSRGVC